MTRLDDLPTKAALRDLARARTRLHAGQASQRVLAVDHDYIGLLGERQFAFWSGLAMNLDPAISGDGRVDFVTTAGTVDVKVNTYAGRVLYLCAEQGRQHADILVLGRYDRAKDDVMLVGWAYSKAVVLARAWNLGRGIVSHNVPAAKLRPMWFLWETIKTARALAEGTRRARERAAATR